MERFLPGYRDTLNSTDDGHNCFLLESNSGKFTNIEHGNRAFDVKKSKISMEREENLLNVLGASLPDLSNSERKVANVILADPERATRSSIAELADEAGVSGPSVNRFCKRFRAEGFPDFKLKLARCLAAGVRYASRNIEPDDQADAYTPKIFNSTISTLELVRDSISYKLVNELVDKMIQAKKIYFCGLGASSAVARDAELKFFRFNLPVFAYNDVLMQRMAAASGATGDLFFFISYTGRTREVVEIAKLARDTGATVVGITAPDSPLARACNLAIEIEVFEDTEEYLPMASRIVDMVILDVLAAGVALKRGVEFTPHLKKIKDSLKVTRFVAEGQLASQDAGEDRRSSGS